MERSTTVNPVSTAPEIKQVNQPTNQPYSNYISKIGEKPFKDLTSDEFVEYINMVEETTNRQKTSRSVLSYIFNVLSEPENPINNKSLMDLFINDRFLLKSYPFHWSFD